MVRIILLVLALALVWLASWQLSRAGGILCGGLGIAGFAFNLWRAWGQGLSTMELINYNFSETSMLLMSNAISDDLCYRLSVRRSRSSRNCEAACHKVSRGWQPRPRHA